ncbi:MAG TPA: DUF6585 family protein [Thermoanaerobaculia bacterium]|jgi:hypothetical protein|nr:DUF6585 family protein [Thermoanaerobaculia bacterium]
MILSPPRAVFGQTIVLRAALGVLFLFAAGISFLIAVGSNPSEFPGIQVGAAVLIAYAVLCYVIGRTKASIFPEGIQVSSVFGTREMLWSDVAEYRYRITPQLGAGFAIGGLAGAAIEAAIQSRMKRPAGPPNLTLIGRDGKKIRITVHFKESAEAIEMILDEVHALLKPELARRLANHEEIAFGPLRLSFQGLTWKNRNPIPLDELDWVGIGGRKFCIRRKGKLFGTLSVPPEKIPDVLLALELIDGLRVNAGLSAVSETFA